MHHRFRRGIAAGPLLAAALVVCLTIGCGTNSSPYPEAKVKTALGTASTCAYCRQPIPQVSEENMLTVKGVAYTVCNAECATKLAEWAKNE